MKAIKHYYHITLIQMTALFVITVAQSYLSLIDVAALSCRCPNCGLLDAILYDSLIAMIILTPIFSLLEKTVHLATTRLYLHSAIVLITWAIINTRLWWERSQCDELSAGFSANVFFDFALPMAVGLAIYLPVYRWARKTTVTLVR